MKIKQVIKYVVVFIALFGGFFVLYLERGAAYAELNNFNLIPQPERFTELYFENSSSLPKETVAHQPISFSFTIHNMEGASTVYPYAAYFEDTQGGKTDFMNGTVTLPDNGSVTVPVSYTFRKSNEVGTVIVDLSSLNQKIDFLLPNNN